MDEVREIAVEDETDDKITDYVVCKKLVQLKQSAISRGIEFDLSFRTVKRLLLQKNCYYTGKKMTNTGLNARSIDRVDSSLGYIEGNVVACTTDINSKKTNLSVEEIMLLSKSITKHYKKWNHKK